MQSEFAVRQLRDASAFVCLHAYIQNLYRRGGGNQELIAPWYLRDNVLTPRKNGALRLTARRHGQMTALLRLAYESVAWTSLYRVDWKSLTLP